MTEAERDGSIVVIDDDHAMRMACEQALAKVGYDVTTFANGAQGLEALATAKPGLALVDLKMPGLSGLDVISRINAIDPTITIIVITGYATIGTAVDAMKAGAYDFLPKPFSPDELRLIVRRGFERRELRLRSQQSEVERELERRRFVTFVSHQLKTPLVAVRQYLDVLRQLGDGPDVTAKRAEWLDRCLARTDELCRLVDDWLTLAQLEGGSLGRQRAPVPLADTTASVLRTCEMLAARAQVTLTADVSDDCVVTGDPTCVGVLIENLVANAVKYNRPGGAVTVRARCGPGEVVLEVTDTGVGIPADLVGRVFDEFFRVRHADGPKIEGTGLGLPICRRIAAEMGGVIEVESTEGAGSTFRVRLPDSETAPDPSTGRSA
jgi:two-component system, sensor histidine kinase and response regulator